MNSRIFFATHAIALKPDGGATWTAVHGLQSFNKTTSFNLEQVFALGQLPIYDNVEGVPNVECTMSKVLDGYPTIWTLASQNAIAPTLSGRGNTKCLIGLSIYNDTDQFAGDTADIGIAECQVSGAFPTNVSYAFPVEGNSTESVTLQASDVVWADDDRMVQTIELWGGAGTASISHTTFEGTDAPLAVGGVSRRQHFKWDTSGSFPGVDSNGQHIDPHASTIPPEVNGISSSGTNNLVGGFYQCSVQSINVSANITREDIFQLGKKVQFFRAVKFPVEVTCEISVIVGSGDVISATNRGIYTSDAAGQCCASRNLAPRTIRLATCEGTRIYLGKKCKLSNVAYTGGDAGGTSVVVNYNYLTYNDFTVLHSADINSNGATWWANQEDYVAIP